MDPVEAVIQKEMCTVTIAADFMEASLHYQPGKEEGGSSVNVISSSDVQQMLNEVGVEYGIDLHAIEQALLSQDEIVQKVASGKAAVLGKDGSLTFFTDYSAGLMPPKLDWSGMADFREIQVIPEIKEGSLIARKNSPVPGRDGRTVTGRVIAAPLVKEVTVQCGAGVYEKENQFFASFSGRLSVDKRVNKYMLDVSKLFIHRGSVDLSSGNIRFQGDIEVQGNVENAMRVEAAGDINVQGQLSGAVIIAGKSVSVRQNVFSSTISCGKMVESTSTLTNTLSGCLPSIIEFAEKLDRLLAQLKNRGQAIDTHAAAQALMERNYPKLPAAIKQFAYETAQTGQSVKKEWSELANKLYRLFIMKSVTGIQVELLKEVVNQALFLQSFYQTEEDEQELFVSIPYAVNSDIVSNKHIYITGQGIFNSTLKAGGCVEVSGCVKGGSVYADTFIKIKEAGSESGVKTTLGVQETGRIELSKVHPEVTVHFGMKQITFYQTEGPVSLFIGEDGRIKKTGLTVEC